MKKVLLLSVFLITAICGYAQLPFVTYEPVVVPNSSSSSSQGSSDDNNFYSYPSNPKPKQSSVSVVGGYAWDSLYETFRRVKLKVREEEAYPNPNLYIVGIYNIQDQSWTSCNAFVYKVSRGSDSDYAVNNFEWKAKYVATGISLVYFNY